MNILEIGNVLSHHIQFEHDVLDRYEIAKGVMNEDVVDFESEKKYDLIVSISTLEHVGGTRIHVTVLKILRAIENLKTLLSKGGIIVITVPLGYNEYLDKLLNEGLIRFTEQYQLIRISLGNEWTEASWSEVQHAKYNSTFPFANALVIGIIRL